MAQKWRQENDYQVLKIRDAENDVPLRVNFLSVEDTNLFIDRIINSKWWDKRSRFNFVDVDYGMKTGPAEWSYSEEISNNIARIHIAQGALNGITLSHELTHLTVWKSDPDHGPVFARALLEFYAKWWGAHWRDKLRTLFDEYGVKYS
jgi:putative metallohydrolase (TIGR04338 family)